MGKNLAVKNKDKRTVIMVCYRDRPTELALLLESLRNQTYQNWDLIISDDASGTPMNNYHFLMCMISKLKEDGHMLYINVNQFGLGVSKNRQKCVDIAQKEFKHCNYYARLDDDIILEKDYLEKLISVIDAGYDLASGVTPPIMATQCKRETQFVKPIINEVILDSTGNIVKNGDDCGFLYLEDEIIPTHHFRSCALYKKELHDKGVDYNNKLSKHGFREEQIFSFKALINGFKLGVHTGAIVWHLLTPSGGERFNNSNQLIQFNQTEFLQTTKRMFKKYGDFISNYNKKFKIKRRRINNLELLKGSNLI